MPTTREIVTSLPLAMAAPFSERAGRGITRAADDVGDFADAIFRDGRHHAGGRALELRNMRFAGALGVAKKRPQNRIHQRPQPRVPQTKDSGALMNTFLVGANSEKIRPKAPNAVMNEAMMVGLKMEMPGMSLLSAPASAWPPLPPT